MRMKQFDEEVVVHEETTGEREGSGRQHGRAYCTTGISQGIDKQYGCSKNLLCLEIVQVQL